MRVLDAVRERFARLANAFAAQRRLSRFACGDCDKVEQCGRAPNEECVHRAAQIERDGDKPRARSASRYFSSKGLIN